MEFILQEEGQEDVEEYVQNILLNKFNIEMDTASVLSSYISGIVEDAYNDPLEARDSIQMLLNDSIDDKNMKQHVNQFAKALVQHHVNLKEVELKNANNLKQQQNNKKQYERITDDDRKNINNNVNNIISQRSSSNKFGNNMIDLNDNNSSNNNNNNSNNEVRKNNRKNRRNKKRAEKKKKKQQRQEGNVDATKNPQQSILQEGNKFTLEKHDKLKADGDDLDDWGTQWVETRETNGIWGGRGRGGRGIQLRNINDEVNDVILEGVTLAYDGEELLTRTRLQIVKGKIYGLIGRNGCGKSTLLKKISRGEVPGWPNSVSVEYVEQEIDISSDKSAIELVVEASKKSLIRKYGSVENLMFERKKIEEHISEENEEDDDDADTLNLMMERLCEIEEALAVLGVNDDDDDETQNNNDNNNSNSSTSRVNMEAIANAKKLLLQFNFSKEQLELPLKKLSGGFRMRIAIARAIICKPDIILFDEPTNHMDLHGVIWLERFMNNCVKRGPTTKKKKKNSKNNSSSSSFSFSSSSGILNYPNFKSIIIVSHDEKFLDNVITDVILFYQKRLQYFVGTYTAYKKMCDETDLRKRRLLEKKSDAEKKAKELAAKQAQLVAKSKKGRKGHSFDPNKQRQAAEKLRKAERAGFYREDGKRYHTMSLKDMNTSFLPKSISVNDLRKDKHLRFKFPSVNAQELRLASPESVLINLDKINFKYGGNNNNNNNNNMYKTNGEKEYLLQNVTVQVNLKSRIAIVGPNGAGKTTLIKLICGKLTGSNKIDMNSNARIALVSQHHIDMLKNHLNMSSTQYLQQEFRDVKATEARSHLGSFGLAGHLALQPVRLLSGGQKARLALAVVMWKKPHILILDEPTNHLDMDSLRALAIGLNDFQGAVLLVSHNQSFLSSISHELWSLDGGKVKVKVGIERNKESFNDLLNEYIENVMF
tara:strand:- start:678 stop:3485 length:2808 start_codon:yes stop_codon:yes gene_type:complete